MNVSKETGSSPGKAKTYQPSLFNLRFGPSRSKRPGSKERERGPESKRRRENDDVVEGIINKQGHDKDVPLLPKISGGTTSDSKELLPVSRDAFLSQYRVEGLESVYYQRDWIDAKTAHRWHSELKSLQEWYRPKLKVYGREIQQSRSIAAFATSPGLELKYSGHQVEMHDPFPLLLEQIAAKLSTDDCLGASVKFNHAMLNSYEDGQVYIGRHSDNMENKVIVTVSLGAPRTWIMEEKKPKGSAEKGKKHKWILENGSLLVMQGSVQKEYTHEIPKEAKVKDSRIVSSQSVLFK